MRLQNVFGFRGVVYVTYPKIIKKKWTNFTNLTCKSMVRVVPCDGCAKRVPSSFSRTRGAYQMAKKKVDQFYKSHM